MNTAKEVFVSVGRTSTPEQERFVSAVEDLLRSNGLEPRTAGRTSFSADQPLVHVRDLMKKCAGTVIVAFERLYLREGTERRGSDKAAPLADVKLPTVWNQVEAALAYSQGHPLLVVVEKGIRSEGLLERGYDWYVQWVDIDGSVLSSKEFQGVFADWKKKVVEHKRSSRHSSAGSPADLTIGQILSGLTPAQLWGTLAALAALIIGAATVAFQAGKGFGG
jgi:hypothetical protein